MLSGSHRFWKGAFRKSHWSVGLKYGNECAANSSVSCSSDKCLHKCHFDVESGGKSMGDGDSL